jgi:cytochrome b involved in lipid metabolism
VDNQFNVFDTVLGLPVHPLVIHAVVVLVPLAGIFLVALIFSPRIRSLLFIPTIILLVLSSGLAYLAQESGKQLANRVGNPASHAQLGSWVLPSLLALTVLTLFYYLLVAKNQPVWQVRMISVVLIGATVATSTLTLLVGHSGAEATWANRLYSSQSQELSRTPIPSAENDTGTYTLSEVAEHHTREDCWTAIEGKVYDLTSYMKQHPGGAGTLAWLCGIDGTKLFESQHGDEGRPLNELAGLEIGDLK